MTAASEEPLPAGESASAAVRQVIGMFRASPFPATLQDPSFHFVEVNAAFVAFTGRPREELIGRDFVELLPPEDRQTTIENRRRFIASGGQVEGAFVAEGRLVDAAGQRRWFRASRSVIRDEQGEPLYLAVLQDTTNEHEARERADRSVREIDDWFDLSPVGMVLFDDSGLLVRTNLAFDEMTGSVPVSLAEASPSLAALLAWGEGGALKALRPGSRPIESQGWVTQPGGQIRRLRAIVRCYRTAGGERRYMGVVEDRSIEEERDLAQMQIGAMMDTAGVGIATFQESTGWIGRRPASGGASVLLQNISRDVVAADSLPEYERLQQALKRTQRAEVRYAIEHPELGRRWLLTRVEPATLASGKKTASVVTLDVTDQQRSQVRSDQLLREMTTILESTTAGIAYLRGGMLVRCNRRFETMLRLPPGTSAGATLAELLARHPNAEAMATEIRDALIAGATYEIEFAFDDPADADDGGARPPGRAAPDQRWFSLSVRSAGDGDGAGAGLDEAIAVLADVSRLKTQQAELETLARDRESMARRTRAILDSVLVGIVIVGAAGIEWMNRSAQRMFGAELAEFLDAPIETVATAEADHPFRDNRYLDELVEGEAATFECRVRARDGREFWVVGNAVATGREDSSRQLTYALLDIERRRQAEAAVSQAQDSLRRVIGAAPLAIALLDAKTLRLVQLNEVAARVVGDTPERLIGRMPEEVFGATVGAARRLDMESALLSSDVTTREYRVEREGALQVWDARYVPLAAERGAPPDQLLLVSTDVTEQRATQEARLEAAIAQRDMLVKEVHHRIKNNLQGVAGLLQQIAKRKPEVAGAIDEVVGQVHAIAQVYGLQVGDTGPLSMVRVLEAITGSVQRTFGRTIRCRVEGVGAADWLLPEGEAIPVALTLNELLTNAIKHSPDDDDEDEGVDCALEGEAGGVRIAITNRADLPAGFNLTRIPNGVSGLGLVRALLPRRGAHLRIEQADRHVVATVALRAPVVTRDAA
ncbi:MAG: PAS domain S-box protein [Burkholderiales bacterium]|nr:PAS domain S-box protein [Burkholderiales bacterium]